MHRVLARSREVEELDWVTSCGRTTCKIKGEIRCRRTRISGSPRDTREYGVGAQILQDLGVTSLRLMTNNPAKYNGLSGYGLEVTGRVPLFAPITLENKRYIDTKRMKMGHLFEMMPHVSEQGEPSR